MSKVLLIGLDGVSWKLLMPWIKEGKLDTFRNLRKEGTWGTLKSTIPCITASALVSLFTGQNQGKTGVFDHVKPDGSPVTLTDISAPKIWNVLDSQDLRSCIVNVRFTYPPEKLKGIMVSGLVPSEKSHYTYPKGLQDQIKGFQLEDLIRKLRTHFAKDPQKHKEEFLKTQFHVDRHKFKVFKSLVEKEEQKYDFLFFWFDGPDFVQHYFWNDDNALLAYFQKISGILDEILQTFSDRTIFIISDHGFEASPKCVFYTNTWLASEGYLQKSGDRLQQFFWEKISPIARKYLPQSFLSSILKLRKKRIFEPKRDIIIDCKVESLPGIDWNNTVAFRCKEWGIEIINDNLEEDYEQVREEILKKLRHLKDHVGKPVIKEAFRKEELFAGHYLDQIPDIIFLTSENYYSDPVLTDSLFGHRTGKAREVAPGRPFIGEHTTAREGFLAVIGNPVKENFHLTGANIYDIAPTILHLLDCAVPEEMDGRVLHELFKPGSYPANRDEMREGFKIHSEEYKLSKKESEKILDKLKDLGYLD